VVATAMDLFKALIRDDTIRYEKDSVDIGEISRW